MTDRNAGADGSRAKDDILKDGELSGALMVFLLWPSQDLSHTIDDEHTQVSAMFA